AIGFGRAIGLAADPGVGAGVARRLQATAAAGGNNRSRPVAARSARKTGYRRHATDLSDRRSRVARQTSIEWRHELLRLHGPRTQGSNDRDAGAANRQAQDGGSRPMGERARHVAE